MSFASEQNPTPKRRKPLKGPPYTVYGFPQVISTHAATRRKSVEIYTRGLLLEGHGYPVYYPYGQYRPSNPSELKPITIGDVGVVESNGLFKWLFNIFLPADRPTQVYASDGFQPFEPPPSESDISFSPKFHKPGTVLTSPGVKVDVRSREPWDIKFTSEENQAGMLILQEGADRYDLKSSEPYHEYIAEHAEHWYQIANNFREAWFPNGSLIIVTGYDSCDSFTHTQYCPEPGWQSSMDLTYTQKLGAPRGNWHNPTGFHNHDVVDWSSSVESEDQIVEGPFTVFVRGIRVSLSGDIFQDIFPPIGYSPHNLHCTLVATSPSKTQLWLEKTKVKLKMGRMQEEMLQNFINHHESTFQPNFIIGQILLGQFPEATLALVEDQIWCSSVEKDRPCTLPEVNKVVSRVLAGCDIVEYQGTIKLVLKKQDAPRQPRPEERILTPPSSWARRRADDDWVPHIPLPKYPWV